MAEAIGQRKHPCFSDIFILFYYIFLVLSAFQFIHCNWSLLPVVFFLLLLVNPVPIKLVSKLPILGSLNQNNIKKERRLGAWVGEMGKTVNSREVSVFDGEEDTYW